MTGLTLLPTQQIWRLNLTKWTTQEDGVASTTALYLRLEHEEANKRLIFSHMDAIQFHQMKTMLQYFRMKGGFFCQGSNKGIYENGVRNNITGEYPSPWVYMQ